VAAVKAIPKERKEFLSALETSAVHQSGDEKKIAGFSLARPHKKVPPCDGAEKYASVRAAIGDHASMQRFDPLAGGALAKPRHESMQKAGAASHKQRTGKGKRHALMLEIAFSDGLRMADKQARKHGRTPF
jgi:hypothetical protein